MNVLGTIIFYLLAFKHVASNPFLKNTYNSKMREGQKQGDREKTVFRHFDEKQARYVPNHHILTRKYPNVNNVKDRKKTPSVYNQNGYKRSVLHSNTIVGHFPTQNRQSKGIKKFDTTEQNNHPRHIFPKYIVSSLSNSIHKSFDLNAKVHTNENHAKKSHKESKRIKKSVETLLSTSNPIHMIVGFFIVTVFISLTGIFLNLIARCWASRKTNDDYSKRYPFSTNTIARSMIDDHASKHYLSSKLSLDEIYRQLVTNDIGSGDSEAKRLKLERWMYHKCNHCQDRKVAPSMKKKVKKSRCSSSGSPKKSRTSVDTSQSSKYYKSHLSEKQLPMPTFVQRLPPPPPPMPKSHRSSRSNSSKSPVYSVGNSSKSYRSPRKKTTYPKKKTRDFRGESSNYTYNSHIELPKKPQTPRYKKDIKGYNPISSGNSKLAKHKLVSEPFSTNSKGKYLSYSDD